MKIRMTNEAKTGIVVLVCVVMLLGLLLKVGNFTLFQHGYTIKSQFHYTAGVKKHAPVRLSGVDVGEVRDIQIIYGDETQIELILWLQDGVKLRSDSKAYVTTLGLMGEKYVEIKAGTTEAPTVKAGEMIPGEDPVRLEELVQMATKVAGDIGTMAKDISKVANHVDEVVVDNKPKLNNIFDNLEETSENFRDFSQDIKYHPWKILAKGKEKTKEEMAKERALRLTQKAGEAQAEAGMRVTKIDEDQKASKQNFGFGTKH